MTKLPTNEQETIILYDNLLKKWHVSTDVTKHIRKYKDVLEVTKLTEENGEIIYLEGNVTGSVSISKKRQLTDEQRQAAADRLKIARQKGQS